MPICIEKSCGLEFEITDGEKEFFSMKGFSLPKRCKDCRDKRKNNGGPIGNTVISRDQARSLKGGRHHPMGGERQENQEESW